MRCRFKHKIFQNEENGYTIAIFTTQDTSVPLSARDKYLASRNIIGFSAIGFGLPLTDEIELEMEGRWESGEHGTQYQVENFMEVVPRTKEGILGYLSSGAIKGIGPKMADTIFRKFGLQTLEIMENNPQELLKIRGISEKKLAAIVESYGKNQVFRELMTFLAPFKVTPKKVNMILKKFGNESVDIIRHRPYMLSAVKGFGFLTVDAIGRQCCCALNDPMRISGCIGHIMNQAMKEGHLFKQRQEVIREALEMLNRDLQVMAVSEQDVSQVLYRLVLQKSIVVEEERIYSIRQYEEETQTASMIARRLLEKPVLLSIEPELEKAQKTLGITLSETQKQAVRMVFAHPISIITGGPGTGKTTVLKVILYIHQALCRSEVQLMAPTGRAARRMVESTGCENASTMHLALGLLGDDTDFEPDFEYLSAGFLNVDEVSMVDMHLAYEFFRRVSRHARVLLVGDKNQLPSVGAGDVFRQLIACGLIPVTVLDLVYRQGALSSIPYNAKLMQENKTNLSFGEDFQFIACKGADEAAEIVRRIYLDEIAKNGMDQVQILTPYRKRSAAGVDELNKSLEDFVNPPIAGKKELHIGSQVFRVGDKILQNKNTEMASNGDLGRILDCITDEDGNARAVIGFPDGRQVQYEADQMEMIEHANATTIHKAQGSECPVVIIPCLKMISGLARPTAGEIEMFGCKGKELERIRSRVGCLIEAPGLYGNMNAYTNLKIKCELFGIRKKGYIEDILETVGLEGVGKKKTKHFSLGMKQRLGIGLALVGEPDLLVLDEPINGLDPQGIAEVRDTIQRLRDERNMTILISSHILEELSKIATDYGIIHNGSLLQELTSEELMKRCSERIEIELIHPEQAVPILDRMGFTNYQVTDKSHIHIFERLNESANVNMELAKAGILVNGISITSEELETYFLNLTGGNQNA